MVHVFHSSYYTKLVLFWPLRNLPTSSTSLLTKTIASMYNTLYGDLSTFNHFQKSNSLWYETKTTICCILTQASVFCYLSNTASIYNWISFILSVVITIWSKIFNMTRQEVETIYIGVVILGVLRLDKEVIFWIVVVYMGLMEARSTLWAIANSTKERLFCSRVHQVHTNPCTGHVACRPSTYNYYFLKITKD